MKRRRSGFSLAELLVAVTLLGIIGGALTRLVVDQMRFFDGVQLSRGARSAARNSMNIVLSELRMVQDSGGITNVAPDHKSVTVNVPYRFGVFCGTTGGVTTVSMLPVDSMTLAMAQYAGYGWRSPYTGRYVTQASGTAPSTGTAATCTGTPGIATISMNGRTGQVLEISPPITQTSTRLIGMPIMFYQEITYSFASSSMFPGKTGLFRKVGTGGTPEELMAPFTTDARFRYYQPGDDTSRTTTPALENIRGLALVLNAVAPRTAIGKNAPSQAKVMTSVFFKNTRGF